MQLMSRKWTALGNSVFKANKNEKIILIQDCWPMSCDIVVEDRNLRHYTLGILQFMIWFTAS